MKKQKIESIDTSKFFLLNLPHFIRYLFSSEVLPMLAIFSLAFIFLPFSTLVYIFLNLIITMMVYKFAFDVLVETSRGNMSPLVKSNYLVSNGVAVKVVVFALLIEVCLMILEKKGVDENYRFYFLAFTAFITPAVYMGLAFSNSIISALNPVAIFRMVKTTFMSYIVFVGFWLGTILLHEQIINPFLFNNFPVFINGIISSFIEFSFLILNFHIMGYIIYQHRDEIEIDAAGYEEVENNRVEIEANSGNPIYSRINKLLIDDDTKQALAIIVELQNNGDSSPELKELSQRALKQKLYIPTGLEIGEKIHSRLRKQEISKAFNLLVEHIEKGKEYKEADASDINILIKHALQINKTGYIPQLVKGFQEKYFNHEDIVPNYFILAKVLYNNHDSRGESKRLLQSLIAEYPNDQSINEVKSWLQGIELMGSK